MSDFKQYSINEDFSTDTNQAGSTGIDRLAVLNVINSFVISPNVIQTSRALVVGTGKGRSTLDPNRGVEVGDITFLESVQADPEDAAAGIIAARVNLPVGGDNVLYVYGSPESTGSDYVFLWDPISSGTAQFPLHRFTVTGGQDSTVVTIRRRGNSPVIGFPNFESPPSTCLTGELTVAGGKLYICTATNTWAVVGTQT